MLDGVGFAVDGADGVGQLGGGQVGGLAQIVTGDRGDGFAALGGIDFGAGGRDGLRRGCSRAW